MRLKHKPAPVVRNWFAILPVKLPLYFCFALHAGRHIGSGANREAGPTGVAGLLLTDVKFCNVAKPGNFFLLRGEAGAVVVIGIVIGIVIGRGIMPEIANRPASKAVLSGLLVAASFIFVYVNFLSWRLSFHPVGRDVV